MWSTSVATAAWQMRHTGSSRRTITLSCCQVASYPRLVESGRRSAGRKRAGHCGPWAARQRWHQRGGRVAMIYFTLASLFGWLCTW
jgi:hypothetical protein